MPTITIYIAGSGTQLANGETSSLGHMWWELYKGTGWQPESFGFAPVEQYHGDPFAPGAVYSDDTANYRNPEYSQTIVITQEQYDAMERFGEDPTAYGFDTYYNGITNSCIDFTWKALEVGGLNPTGVQGDLLPTWNKDNVDAMVGPSEALFGDLMDYYFSPTGSTRDTYAITITPNMDSTATGATDPTSWDGLAASGGGWSVTTDANFLNNDQLFNGFNNNTFSSFSTQTLTDSFRPGDFNLAPSTFDLDHALDFLNTPPDQMIESAWLNYDLGSALNTIPTDPLVLDLNGDGVRLTDWLTDPVLFDTDHDGGSRELTGWVSREDGMVVMDRNGNGKIDDISEIFSEYFGGTVGANGNAGTKPYANGLVALKSLDSNHDNAFTSADASSWTSVKVWQDTDHDGVTDSGELKTLSSLNITRINLTQTSQSGLMSNGNEILASSTFVQNGVTKEAIAANFLTDPRGQTSQTNGSGLVFTNQGDATVAQSKTYAAGDGGESINLATKVTGGVDNTLGGAGNDTFTGTAGNNWLVGGQGSDTFSAGAGDDVLAIDAEDQQANIHGGTGNDIVQVVGDQGVTLNLVLAEIEGAIGGRGDAGWRMAA